MYIGVSIDDGTDLIALRIRPSTDGDLLYCALLFIFTAEHSQVDSRLQISWMVICPSDLTQLLLHIPPYNTVHKLLDHLRGDSYSCGPHLHHHHAVLLTYLTIDLINAPADLA